MFTADIIRLAVVADVQCATGKCVSTECSGGGGIIAGPIKVGADA